METEMETEYNKAKKSIIEAIKILKAMGYTSSDRLCVYLFCEEASKK